MRLSSLLGPDLRAVLESDPESLRDALGEFHAEDIAEILDDLEPTDRVALMQVLTPELAASVMERISPEHQVSFLRAISPTDGAQVLSEMDPDDLVDVLQELEDKERAPLLDELERFDVEAADEARELVLYGPETAGGLMTTEYVALPPQTKVWEAIEAVRRAAAEGEVESIYYVYVCGYGEKLLGVVSLRDLILGDPGHELEHVMTEKVVHVGPLDDQEKVAEFKPTVADVHTAPTDEFGNDVGWVLHGATGRPMYMVFTVQDCSGVRAYIGPVSSYHPVLTEGFQRLTDSEWGETVSNTTPARAPWVDSFVR